MSEHKARQAEKARKAGVLGDVLSKKTSLREAASRGQTKKRKTAEWTFAELSKALSQPHPGEIANDQLYKKWTKWLNQFAPSARGASDDRSH